MLLGPFRSSRSTHTPEKWYRYRPSPKQVQARLNACASALVPALSSSAHSSPVADWEPRPKIVSSHATRTLATTLWSLSRWKLALVWMAYLRVQPAGVTNRLRRSVYALWSAYGTTWPRGGLPFLVVLVTRQSICEGSNGTSRSATRCRISSALNCLAA